MGQKFYLINREQFILYLLLFPLFLPSAEAVGFLFGTTISTLIHNIIIGINSIGIFLLLLIFSTRIYCYGIRSVNKTVWVLCALPFWYLLVSLKMGHLSEVASIKPLINLMALFILFELYSKEKILVLLRALYIYVSSIMVLNAISIYMYSPSGMYIQSGITDAGTYLYGLDNICFIYSLGGFFTGAAYYLTKFEKLPSKFLGMYFFIGSAFVYCKTGAGTVCFFLTILLVCTYKNGFYRVLTYNKLLIWCAFFWVLICLLQTIDVFSSILTLIGKESSLNGRFIIWAIAVQGIQEHFLTGVGISRELTEQVLLAHGLPMKWMVGHMHNIVFEILFKSGIIGFIIFIINMFLPLKYMRENKNFILSRFLCGGFFITWLSCLVEFRIDTFSYWFIPLIMLHIDELRKINIDEKSK